MSLSVDENGIIKCDSCGAEPVLIEHDCILHFRAILTEQEMLIMKLGQENEKLKNCSNCQGIDGCEAESCVSDMPKNICKDWKFKNIKTEKGGIENDGKVAETQI